MNKVILMGRLARDPEVRYSQTQNGEDMAIARSSIAVDRRGRDNGADFISCVAFGKTAETIEKFLHKGSKIALDGHIQTGSYTNKDGAKVYTTDVVVDSFEFAESKASEGTQSTVQATDANEFMNIPDNIDEELPFN